MTARPVKALVAAALAATAASGCGDRPPTLDLVLDLPAVSSPAFPFDGAVDALQISVALEGSSIDLQSRQRPVGDALVLDDVPFGADLVVHLSGTFAGAEVAYGRSCPFSFAGDDGDREVHLYFSRIVQFAEQPGASIAERVGGHAFVRRDGTVILAGGRDAAPVEAFNPTSGAFVVLGEAGQTAPREGGRAARVGDDQAVIAGGTAGGEPVLRIETLPALGDSFDGELGLRGHQLTALVGELAVITGGETWNGSAFALDNEAFELSVGDGGVVSPPRSLGPMIAARTRHTATRLGDETGASVLVAGGLDAAGQPVTTVEAYRPLSESFVELPLATLARWDHQAVPLAGGAVAIVGGFTLDADNAEIPATDIALFDPVEGRFVIAGELPASAAVTGFSTTLLPDGRALLAGGRDAGGALTSTAHIVILDPFNGEINAIPTDSLASPRADHVAALVCDGTVIIAGGEADGGGAPVERYNPPSADRR